MPALQSPIELLERVHSLIGDALVQSEKIFDAELVSQNEYVGDIIAHTRKFRGKRLRPVLLLLTARAAGNLNDQHPVLAAVVEMIHTATLIHDDVLDLAETRRHVATVNIRWNNETSVLYGDYLFTHAFRLAASLETTTACRLIGRATNIVCEGELSQVRHRGDYNLTEDEYLQVIDGKTGALCAISCRLGALYAGATNAQVDAAEKFGGLLGRAFQIADDLLDLTGSEKTVGKTLGTDLAQGKLTLPLIRLLSTVSADEKKQLIALMQEGSEESAGRVVKMCRERGVIEESRRQALKYAQQAVDGLKCYPESDAREILKQMALMAVERNC